MNKTKLAILCTHPIQYFSPWFRFLAEGQKAGGRRGQAGGEIKEESGRRKADTNPSTIFDLPSANLPESFKFEVFYAHKQTAKGQAEAGFGVEFDWDVPLLEGYPYRFLKNVSKKPGLEWFGGCDCPEIGEILVKEGFTHVLLIGWHKKVFWQAFWAAKKAGIKVLSRGDSHLGKQKNPLKIIIKEFLYRILLPRFDAHLFVGRRNLEYLKHYGVRNSRLFFSPHFVDNQWWAARSRDAGAKGLRGSGDSRKMEDGRSEMGSSQPPISHLPDPISEKRGTVFLFAGKFTEEKRPMDPLLALKDVPEAQLLYVGDGPMRAQMEQEARINRLDERVQFLGFKNQRELPALLASIDCLILPGNESWGLIVNEAMACGKPAIVSEACGCAPDLIEEGETGYSFKLGNARALAGRLREFVEHKDRDWATKVRAKIGQYSMERATEGLARAIEARGSQMGDGRW